MAKKVRRTRRKRDENKGIPTSVPASGSRRPSIRAARKKADDVNLEEEYSYVVKDLRRIFILAIVMFVLLIAANIAFQFVGV